MIKDVLWDFFYKKDDLDFELLGDLTWVWAIYICDYICLDTQIVGR